MHKKILIIRFSSLGDLILMTPLVREMKKFFPQAQIDLLTSTTFAGLCQNNPHLNQIIELDRKAGADELKKIAAQCLENHYDLIFDAHNSIRSRLIKVKCCGWFYKIKPNIYSINKRSLKRSLLITFNINLLKNHISQREAFLGLLAKFSSPSSLDSSTELFPSPADKERVRHILKETGLNGNRIVAIGPGASFVGKCWPKESYLELTNRLIGLGLKVVLLGGETDEEPAWIYENTFIKPVNLAGKLSFLETAELLRNCALSISNDTALVHFAEAMQTPAMAIFGPTAKEFGFAPFLPKSRMISLGLNCSPCSRNGKGECKTKTNRQCLSNISVQTVFENALEIIK